MRENPTTGIHTYLFIAFKWIPQLTNDGVNQTALYIVVLKHTASVNLAIQVPGNV